jgi:surfeit locus 1 family protein
VTPLRLAGSDRHVLVDRGWIAAPSSRALLPEVRTPANDLEIDGIALERLPHALEAGAAPLGKVRQNLDIAAFAAETGLRLEPLVIEQRSEGHDGLVRDWPRPDFGVEKHESYALQWYSFAALAIILLIVLSTRRAPGS